MGLFNGKPRSWREKVLNADVIWGQVEKALALAGAELPKTPRRPDVRLIVNNVSGVTQLFRNPAGHAGDKAEQIPAEGDSTAAMVMVAGKTLSEQYANAARLYEKFNLGAAGLSADFVAALQEDRAGGLVAEAYGPAPFEGQSGKLVQVDWVGADGAAEQILPVKGVAASFGARAAESQTAFAARIAIAVQGTGTSAELVEDAVMVIGVNKDWKTGAISTRPIVASVAKEFYGTHFDKMPVVTINPEGLVQKIDLKDGRVVNLAAPKDQAVVDLNRLKIA